MKEWICDYGWIFDEYWSILKQQRNRRLTKYISSIQDKEMSSGGVQTV